MPTYPPTTNVSLRLDATTQARATDLIDAIQAAWDAYCVEHPDVDPGPPVDVAYVYFAAVTVGLSRWKTPNLWAPSYPAGQPPDVPTSSSFATHAGTGVSTISVAVNDLDIARKTAIATALGGGAAAAILGRACCTGVNMLSGYDVDAGPFT